MNPSSSCESDIPLFDSQDNVPQADLLIIVVYIHVQTIRDYRKILFIAFFGTNNDTLAICGVIPSAHKPWLHGQYLP